MSDAIDELVDWSLSRTSPAGVPLENCPNCTRRFHGLPAPIEPFHAACAGSWEELE